MILSDKTIYKYLESGELVIDPLTQDSPIAIDWVRWLNARHKYDKRNAHFVLAGEKA